LLLFRLFAIRYFNTSFCYRYSATILKIAIYYSLFAIATFFLQCCGLHQFYSYISGEKICNADFKSSFKPDGNSILNNILMLNISLEKKELVGAVAPSGYSSLHQNNAAPLGSGIGMQ
jgi:hypothetical protein